MTINSSCSAPHVNMVQYKNVVDQALSCLLGPLALKVVDVLKEMCDDWWGEKVLGNKKVKDGLEEPRTSDESDLVGVLQISSCCELVFTDIAYFSKKWGERCRGLINLVREARNRSSHRQVDEPDFTAEDAEYYLYAIFQTGKMIKADSSVVATLQWLHECLWLGRVPSYSPTDDPGRISEPAVRELVPFKPALRWFDSEDFREEVARRIDGISDDAVLEEMERRIGDEVRLAEIGWEGWVCTYRDGRDDIVDEPCITLVFLLHNTGPDAGEPAAGETEVADRIMAGTGGRARVNRNMLMFVFSDNGSISMLKSSIRVYLALSGLMSERAGDLQAVEFLKEADADCRRMAREAFSNLLVPEPGWEVRQPRYRRLRLDGCGNIVERAFGEAAREGLAYGAAAGDGVEQPFRLRDIGWPEAAGDVGFIRIEELWERLCSMPDCPKIESRDVLLHAVWSEVLEGRYGYAEDVETCTGDAPPDGPAQPKCIGLRFRQDVHDISAEGFIVSPDVVALNMGILVEPGPIPPGDGSSGASFAEPGGVRP